MMFGLDSGMPLRVSALFLLPLYLPLSAVASEGTRVPPAAARAGLHYVVAGDEKGSWPGILESIGWLPADGSAAAVGGGHTGTQPLIVIPSGMPAAASTWRPRIEQGAVVIGEGASELAESLGISPGEGRVVVRSLRDVHDEKLEIIWERAVELPAFRVPASARVFTRERWREAPLVAGVRLGKGAFLWLATPPGEKGHERYPYLLQAVTALGVRPPFAGRGLWAFFDSSYQLRTDPEYLAARWRESGIAGLHVAAWHFYDSDPARDEYLRKLIEACHKRAILVYAWLEYPHVSEKFWNDHPEWREKTAVGQDAHLDWRKLMNLTNPDCAAAVKLGTHALVARFDWDGVNLAELYFESLEGIDNLARFTPFNADVRAEFQSRYGADPLDVAHMTGHELRPQLFDFRAQLAQRLQEEWLAEMNFLRRAKPHLDIVLTHVDDRFDTRMRTLIGAESARILPLLEKQDFTFLIEDPATIWHLGPQRYPQIAARYADATPRQDKLAIDINVVERYQDVYPTKQQTGVELFQLVHLAGQAFPRVALYFENSIRRPDLPLLAASAARVSRAAEVSGKLVVDSPHGTGLAWEGAALVNGKLWPITDGKFVWLPPGPAVVEPAPDSQVMRVLDFNGGLRSAGHRKGSVEIAYHSAHRAIAVLDRKPAAVELDGAPYPVEWLEDGNRFVILLPRGQHIAEFLSAPPPTKPAPGLTPRAAIELR